MIVSRFVSTVCLGGACIVNCDHTKIDIIRIARYLCSSWASCLYAV